MLEWVFTVWRIMPFPLAHPAAVLPFRRWCPRFLSLPALVVGSVCPAAAYAIPWWDLATRAHQVIGSMLFCMPLGLLAIWLFYRVRLPLLLVIILRTVRLGWSPLACAWWLW